MIKNIILLTIIAITTKAVTFVFDIILTYKIGITPCADAFNMVISIYAVIYPMLSIGIWKIFLPEYIKLYKKSSNIELNNFTNSVITYSSTFFFIFSVLLCIFSENIVNVIAPGFDEYRFKLTSEILALSSFQYFFVLISAFYAAMLNAREKFLVSQSREILYYVPLIICIIFFYEKYNIYSLAAGLVLSAILRFVILLPFCNWGYKFKICFSLDEKVTHIFKSMPSAMATASLDQIAIFIGKFTASFLGSGAVSCLTYGFRLQNAIGKLVGTALSIVLLPSFTTLLKDNRLNDLSSLIKNVITIFSFYLIPISLYCYYFGESLVGIIFQRGAFDHEATVLTASAFSMYCIGLVFINLFEILNNIFYAKGDTKTPLTISAYVLSINIILTIILSNYFGISGIAFASSFSSILSFLFILTKINLFLPLNIISIAKEIFVIAILSVFSLFVILYIEHSHPILNFGDISVIFFAILYFLLFVAFAFILKIPSLSIQYQTLITRLKNNH